MTELVGNIRAMLAVASTGTPKKVWVMWGVAGLLLALFFPMMFMFVGQSGPKPMERISGDMAIKWEVPIPQTNTLKGVKVNIVASEDVVKRWSKVVEAQGGEISPQGIPVTWTNNLSGTRVIVNIGGTKEERELVERALQDGVRGLIAQESGMTFVPIKTPKGNFQEAVKEITHKAKSVSMFGALVTLGGVFVLISAFMGVSMDLYRAMGVLEPWALVHRPLWVWYGGKILQLMGVASLMLVPSLALIGFKLFSWPFVIPCLLAYIVGAMVWGLWSVFTTVLFHHSMGRMFARLALSPVMLILFGVARLIMLKKINSTRAPGEVFDEIMRWGTRTDILWMAVGIGIVLIPTLILLIEWRIGVRRVGLRQVVGWA